jgi:hypothetical protein
MVKNVLQVGPAGDLPGEYVVGLDPEGLVGTLTGPGAAVHPEAGQAGMGVKMT